MLGVAGDPASTFNPYSYVRGNTINLIDFMYGNQGVRDVMDSLGICPDVVAAGIRAVAGKLDELADVVLEAL